MGDLGRNGDPSDGPLICSGKGSHIHIVTDGGLGSDLKIPKIFNSKLRARLKISLLSIFYFNRYGDNLSNLFIHISI